MPDRWDEPLVREVAVLLSARTGLDFNGARGRWLQDFLSSVRRGDTSWFRAVLSGDPEAFASLCELATVQESYFFREPGTLGFLSTKVFPMLAERPGDIRVWSAGCAGGQEAYTVAMLLADAGLAGRARVLGTDLSEEAVRSAREAVFGSWSMRGVDERTKARCFETSGKSFTLVSRHHARVDFEQHNLLDPEPPSPVPFDLVLCRNVLIYLTPEAVREVGARLAGALRPGGWLVTGVSDPPLHGVEGLEPVATPNGTAYRRPERPTAASTSGDPGPVALPRRHVPSVAPRATPRPRTAPPARHTSPPPRRRPVASSWTAEAEHALFAAEPRTAERLARAALDSATDRQTAHVVLVQALAADDRLGEALEAARIAVAEFPVSGELRSLQAVTLLDSGRPEDAREAARQALYLDPGSTLAHLTLARSSDLLGDVQVARRARRNGQRLLARGVRP